jgi:hypothetical protein
MLCTWPCGLLLSFPCRFGFYLFVWGPWVIGELVGLLLPSLASSISIRLSKSRASPADRRCVLSIARCTLLGKWYRMASMTSLSVVFGSR